MQYLRSLLFTLLLFVSPLLPFLLLVLSGPIVVLPTAWLAWRMIRKSYG